MGRGEYYSPEPKDIVPVAKESPPNQECSASSTCKKGITRCAGLGSRKLCPMWHDRHTPCHAHPSLHACSYHAHSSHFSRSSCFSPSHRSSRPSRLPAGHGGPGLPGLAAGAQSARRLLHLHHLILVRGAPGDAGAGGCVRYWLVVGSGWGDWLGWWGVAGVTGVTDGWKAGPHGEGVIWRWGWFIPEAHASQPSEPKPGDGRVLCTVP